MEQKPLAWSPKKKMALLGHLLIDDRFARGLGSNVAAEWFGSETALVQARSLQLRFLEEFGRLPTALELPECKYLHGADDQERKDIETAVCSAVELTKEFPLDALQKEVLHWYQDLLFRDAWHRAGAEYQRGRDDEARKIMAEMVRKTSVVTIGRDQLHRFDEFEHFFQDVEQQYAGALTWGHPLIDSVVCPEALDIAKRLGQKTAGSLLPGMVTVLLAGTNVGKSRVVNTVAIHNAMAGEPCLVIVHEDREADSAFNFWSATLRVTRGEFLAMIANPETCVQLKQVAAELQRNIDFIYIPAVGLTVEEIVSIVRRRNDERRAMNSGKGYSLFIDDYPQKLTAQKVTGDLRHIQAYVYQQLIALTRELGFHSILPIQANRAGNNMARAREQPGAKQQRLRWLMSGDVSEVFNPIMDADNVFSINRPPDIEAANLIVYYFEKMKSSMYRGWAVSCESHFEWALAHAPDSRAVSFRSEWAEADEIKSWLKNYNGVAVPMHLLNGGGR